MFAIGQRNAQSVLETEVVNGMPGFIQVAGYPQVSYNGHDLFGKPHWSVFVTEACSGKTCSCINAYVFAHGTMTNGQGRSITVQYVKLPDCTTRENILDAVHALCDEAIATAAALDVDAQYTGFARAVDAYRAKNYTVFTSRAEYKTACRAEGVGIRSDAECDSYGVKYGQFWFPEYSFVQCVEMWLADLRRQGLARRPLAPASADDYPNGRELDCGHVVYNAVEVMTASLGASCSECYDRMSD